VSVRSARPGLTCTGTGAGVANPMQADARGVTARQARLIYWLKHPGPALPDAPAIDPVAAMWTAQEIVDYSGIYRTRAEALRDLNILRGIGTVTGMGGRWRYIRPHEDIRG
jgi:hypothetical protein